MNPAAGARSTVSIQAFAREHGVSAAAVRHYERHGLLDERHVVRAANGYRRFTPLASERLRLIGLGRLAGFTLREMRTRFAHWDDGTMPVEDKKRVLTEHLAKVRTRMDELRAVEALLVAEIAEPCEAQEGTDPG